MATFLACVKGQSIARRLFSRGLSAVSAWEDHEEARLKMAQKKTDATRDPEKLRERCVGRPGAIALLAPGVVVVDLDRKNGVDGVSWWEKTVGPLPSRRAVVTTPRNGIHIWVVLPHVERVVTRTGTLGPGVDLLGTSSVVPIPGSRTRLGSYEAHDDFAFLRAPAKLLALIQPEDTTPVRFSSQTGNAALRRFADEFSCAPEGSNKTNLLNRVAFMAGLKPNGIPIGDLGLLVDVAVRKGIRESVAWSTAIAGYKAGQQATPRGVR